MLRDHRRPVTLGIIPLAAALLTGSAAIAANPPWTYVVATRTGGAQPVEVRLWHRGTDAVIQELQGDQVVRESRCDGNEIRDQDPRIGQIVLRVVSDKRECFALATDSILGFTRRAQDSGYRPVAAIQFHGRGATRYLRSSGDGPVEIVVDNDSGLPLFADFGTEQYTWEYAADPLLTRDPPPGVVAANATETYRDVASVHVARQLALEDLPPSIGGLPLDATFTYEAERTGGPVYNAIWTSDREATISLVIGNVRLPTGEMGLADEGSRVSLRVQLNERYLQISAPSREILRSALAKLRPELVGEVP